jgi:hypothetical protein
MESSTIRHKKEQSATCSDIFIEKNKDYIASRRMMPYAQHDKLCFFEQIKLSTHEN